MIDAHCHLANLAETHALEPLLLQAQKAGISGFISSALRRSEIQWHRQNPSHTVIWSTGIHPNFDECDITLDDLEDLARRHQIHAIGECGLDRGNPDLHSQIEILGRQLSLAERYDLPVILHLVGLLHVAIPLLKHYPLTYLVHGYAGSKEGLNQLMALDSYFTISSRICKPDHAALLTAIIASGRYFLETDITQYYVQEGETNPLLRLLDLVDRVIELTGIGRSEFIDRQWTNYCILFGESDV